MAACDRGWLREDGSGEPGREVWRGAGRPVRGERLFHESLAALLEQWTDLPARRLLSPSHLSVFMKLRPALRVVLVCRGLSREEFAEAADLGFDTCISEEDGLDRVVDAVRTVLRSEPYARPVDPSTREPPRAEPPAYVDTNGPDWAIVTAEERIALQQSFEADRDRQDSIRLTPREREVLTAIVEGKSEPQIGEQLGLSPRTVHSHRTNIMRKLDVHNSIALVRSAVRLGLAEL